MARMLYIWPTAFSYNMLSALLTLNHQFTLLAFLRKDWHKGMYHPVCQDIEFPDRLQAALRAAKNL